MTNIEVAKKDDGSSETMDMKFKCPLCGSLYDEREEARECLLDCYTEDNEGVEEVLVKQEEEELEE